MRVITERHIGKKVVFGTIAWAIMYLFLRFLFNSIQITFGWISSIGIVGYRISMLIYFAIFALSVSAAIFVCELIDAHYDVSKRKK